MRLLVGIKSCMRAWMDGAHEVIRSTWGAFLPPNVDLRFFYGDGTGWMLWPAHDEVYLNVPDDYLSLPQKTKAMSEWALNQKYEYACFCDNDTFIHPERLMSSGFEGNTLSSSHPIDPYNPGNFQSLKQDGEGPYLYPNGGFGYCVNAAALQILAASPVGEEHAEDRWVGHMMHKNGIEIHRIPKFSWHFPRDMYPSCVYNPKFPWQQMMADYHLLKRPSAVQYWNTPIGMPATYRKVLCVLNPGDKEE